MNKFEKVSFTQYLNANGKGTEYCTRYNDEYNNLKLPKRATAGSAGYDFFAPFTFKLKPGETIKIPTGIKIHLDDDKFLALYPRSGLGFKYRVQLDNTVGIIDSDYINSDNVGHIFIKLTNDSRNGKTVYIEQGDAFAQGIITQFFKTDDDSADGERNGGMGSTGNGGRI